MYGEMSEDDFHLMMGVNDLTYYLLFNNNRVFPLNVYHDWQNATCLGSCAAIGDARYGFESQGTGIQSARKVEDSGCILSEIDNILTNMSGSSNLIGTGHTNQVKPNKLSVRFILSGNDRNLSDDELSFVSDMSDISAGEDLEWWSCDDEDECFYDADNLIISTGYPNLTPSSQPCDLSCFMNNPISTRYIDYDTPEKKIVRYDSE